ncbi:MAG: exo-alpha-sialidase [Fluviicola sp.]|nr:exo-alpha-sialidase [Fluviicola sp.]
MKILLTTAAFFVCIASIQAQLHGIDAQWYQQPSPISKFNADWNAKGAVANNMIVDHNGRVIVFYTEENNNQSTHYFTGSADNGVTWDQPSPTVFTPSLTTNLNSTLSVDMDTNEIIHVIWSSREKKALFYVSASASTLTWSDTMRIGSTDKNRIGFCQVSADRKNRVHAYWNEGEPGSADTAEVFYARSINSGVNWSTQTMLSTGEARHSAFPSGDFYGVDHDTLAIAWRDSIGPGNSNTQDWDVKMVISTDGGASWTVPFTAAGGSGMQSDPAVVVDKNGVIHVCYHYYPQFGGVLSAKVMYAHSNDLGINWSPVGFTQISVSNIQSHLAKEAYDYENDVVWYFYKDQRDYVDFNDKRADIMAVYVQNSGTTLSVQEFISDADSNEVGFHNFKVGRDGIPRAHFFIIPYGTDSTSLFYTQRSSLNLSTPELNQDDALHYSCYPNPVNEVLYFDKTISRIAVYNSLGQLIYGNASPTNQLSTKDFENGFYFIHSQGTIHKIIVTH